MLAIFSGQVTLGEKSLVVFLRNPAADGDFRTFVIVIFLTGAMALFPDVDTESRPRKYFHRVAFGVMGGLLFLNELEVLALLALAVMAPMLHKHRGWTHHWLTPWGLAALFAVVWEYLRTKNAGFSGYSWENALSFLADRWIFAAAIVLGHYTHLLLDSRLVARVFRRRG